jgi:3-oxoadipate enol-lactonase
MRQSADHSTDASKGSSSSEERDQAKRAIVNRTPLNTPVAGSERSISKAEGEHRRNLGRNQAACGLEPLKAADASYATADDGSRIYYEVFAPTGDAAGHGRPPSEARLPVLLVMGLGANGRLWAPATRRLLSAGYEVITLDNRGCGRSSTPWRPWTTRKMARDATTVLNELGIQRANIGGASLGGMVAQELAIESSERVRTLVLVATTGGLRRLDLAPVSGLRHVVEAGLRSLGSGSDPEGQIRNFLRMAASEDFVAQCQPGDEAWESVAEMLEDPAGQRGVALQLLAAIRHSTWSRLPQLGMPVQIHHGELDALIPLSDGRELARRIPHAKFEFHPGAGHGLFERSEEVADSILAFLAE